MTSKALTVLLLQCLLAFGASVATTDDRIVSQNAEGGSQTSTHRRSPALMRSEVRIAVVADLPQRVLEPQVLAEAALKDDMEDPTADEGEKEDSPAEADDDSLGAEGDALLDQDGATDEQAIGDAEAHVLEDAAATAADSTAALSDDIPKWVVTKAAATSNTCCGGATSQQVGIEGQAANSAAIVALAKETAKDAKAIAKLEAKEIKDLATFNLNETANSTQNVTIKRKGVVPCYTLSGLKKLIGWGCGGELKALAMLDADDRKVIVAQDKLKNDVAKLQNAEIEQLKADETQAKVETQKNVSQKPGTMLTSVWSKRANSKQIAGIKQLSKEAKILAKDATALENAERRQLSDASGCNNKSESLTKAKEADAVAAAAKAKRVKTDVSIVSGIADREKAVKLGKGMGV